MLGGSSPEESSTRQTSVSASSTTNGPSGSGFSAPKGESSVTSAPDAVAPPPLSAFKKKRRQSHRKRVLEKRLGGPSQSRRTRYWNEFDDGSEGSGNEAYTIFVDPNASYGFPGAATMSKLVNSLISNINAAEQKVASWIKPSHEPKVREHEALLNGERSPASTILTLRTKNHLPDTSDPPLDAITPRSLPFPKRLRSVPARRSFSAPALYPTLPPSFYSSSPLS